MTTEHGVFNDEGCGAMDPDDLDACGECDDCLGVTAARLG